MEIDRDRLRRQFASLTDEALLDIKRSDLIEAAQSIYDEEIKQRGLKAPRGPRRPSLSDDPVSTREYVTPSEDDGPPEWLSEAAEAMSRVIRAGTEPVPDLADARDALEAAGIPCYLELEKIPAEMDPRPALEQLKLMVPGEFNLRAANVLDRDIFNKDYEAEWKTLLETLSDKEVLAMKPEVVFCGLFDRIERVTRAYEAERKRRGI